MYIILYIEPSRILGYLINYWFTVFKSIYLEMLLFALRRSPLIPPFEEFFSMPMVYYLSRSDKLGLTW